MKVRKYNQWKGKTLFGYIRKQYKSATIKITKGSFNKWVKEC